MEKDTGKIIKIRSYNSIDEAQLYRALLESAGIQVRLQNDLAAQVLPLYGAMIQINLLVSEDDRARAEEILSARFDPEELEKEQATYPQNDL